MNDTEFARMLLREFRENEEIRTRHRYWAEKFCRAGLVHSVGEYVVFKNDVSSLLRLRKIAEGGVDAFGTPLAPGPEITYRHCGESVNRDEIVGTNVYEVYANRWLVGWLLVKDDSFNFISKTTKGFFSPTSEEGEKKLIEMYEKNITRWTITVFNEKSLDEIEPQIQDFAKYANI